MHAFLEGINSTGQFILVCVFIGALAAMVISPLLQLTIGGSYVALRAFGAVVVCGVIALLALYCYTNTLPSVQYVADKHGPTVTHHQHRR